jgi:DNA polymerase I-like protein with 3'-5' exonuclease and polymerase domains
MSPAANLRTIANFPMQANGAEILRLACCMAVQAGIRVCAPVHDALLVAAPIEEIEQEVAKTQAIMREASEIVLGGFPLNPDIKVIRHPDRYMDPRGRLPGGEKPLYRSPM